MKKFEVLFFFLPLFVQPAYAWQCGTCQDSTGKFIGGICLDGTPVPRCPHAVAESNTTTHTVVVVNGNTQPAPTQPPKIVVVTVVMTAAPTPTPIVKVIYRTIIVTPMPTQAPTATPSATRTPTPTKIQKPKTIAHPPTLFQ